MGNLVYKLKRKKRKQQERLLKIRKEELLGKISTEARIILYEKTVVTKMICNLEFWTEIEDSMIKRLEKIQGKILKGILQLPESTPYWGIVKDIRVWPIKKESVTKS